MCGLVLLYKRIKTLDYKYPNKEVVTDSQPLSILNNTFHEIEKSFLL